MEDDDPMYDPTDTSFFEEQAAAQVRTAIDELRDKWGRDLEQAAGLAGWDAGVFREKLDNGDLTVRQIAELLYFLNYRMLFTVRPMGKADLQQAENWRTS